MNEKFIIIDNFINDKIIQLSYLVTQTYHYYTKDSLI